jgi:putative peptidoglycan lipid II flippase
MQGNRHSQVATPAQSHSAGGVKGVCSTQIGRSAGAIALISAVGAVFGFLTQALLALLFGAGRDMDCFLVASTLPLLVLSVFSGAVTYAFMPVFMESRSQGEGHKAWIIAGNLLYLSMLGLLGVAALLSLWSSQLVGWMAPGLSAEAHAKAWQLLRIQSWSIPIAGTAALLGTILYAEKMFLVPALAALLNSAVICLAVWALAGGYGITVVAWSTLAGSAANLLLLVPHILRHTRLRMRIDLHDAMTGRVLKLMLPLLIGAVFYRADSLIQRYLASDLPAGGISYLGYAAKLVMTTTGLLAAGLPVVSLAYYADLVNSRNYAGLVATFSSAYAMLSSLALLVLALFVLAGADALTLLFQRGSFDEVAVRQTWLAMLCYAGVLYAGLVGSVVTPIFYAYKDSVTCVLIGVGGALLQIALSVPLLGALSFLGLALAYSCSNLITILVFLVVLNHKYVPLPVAELAGKFVRQVAVAAGVTMLFWLIRQSFLAHLSPLVRVLVLTPLVTVSYFSVGMLVFPAEVRFLLALWPYRVGRIGLFQARVRQFVQGMFCR